MTIASFPQIRPLLQEPFLPRVNSCPRPSTRASALPRRARILSTDWTARVWAEFRAGNLTRVWRDVLLTLKTYRGHGGLICPSHATLAERARCSVRTVQRALAMGRRLGLVSWSERRVRAA